MKSLLYNVILLLLLTYSYAAPLESQTVKTVDPDPELTGGYFEGDMEIEVTRNGLIAERKKWPNGVVYYKIDEVFGKKKIINLIFSLTI